MHPLRVVVLQNPSTDKEGIYQCGSSMSLERYDYHIQQELGFVFMVLFLGISPIFKNHLCVYMKVC